MSPARRRSWWSGGSAFAGDPDAWFRQEWVRELFERSIAELRRRLEAAGKRTCFVLFQRYDVEGPDAVARPTYPALAAELGIPVTQVTNFLALARREFREHRAGADPRALRGRRGVPGGSPRSPRLEPR